MKVLVTGGSGFLGAAFVDTLLKRNYEVINFDLNPPDETDRKPFWIQGDIRDPLSTSKALLGVDAVIHCAALVPLTKNSKGFSDTNSLATELLLSLAQKYRIKRFQYISSSAVYGAPKNLPVTESSLRNPFENYGKAKLSGEISCENLRGKSEMQIGIIRPRTIIGHGRLGIFQLLFDWIADGYSIPVLSGGKNIYQFIHVTDLVEGSLLALEKAPNDSFNLGAKNFCSMKDSLSAICSHAQTGSKLISFPRKLTETAIYTCGALGLAPLGAYHAVMYGKSLYFDISKAQSVLQWDPKHTNQSMLIEAYDWYIANRKLKSKTESKLSIHRSGVPEGILSIMKRVWSWM